MTASIFISYRGADAGGHAGRLYDRLRRWFEPEELFFDNSTLETGDVFPELIDTNIRAANAVLVVIGPDWLETLNERAPRLDSEVDFVRREIAVAIQRHVAGEEVEVLPVLVGGASMPTMKTLQHPELRKKRPGLSPSARLRGRLELRPKSVSVHCVGGLLDDPCPLDRWVQARDLADRSGRLDSLQRPPVDGTRMAIRGGSAGGYTTLCALTFHDVFAAGASHYGIADAEALARDTHKFESRYLDSMRNTPHFWSRSRISISGGSVCADGFLVGVPFTLQWPPMAVREALYRRS